MSLYATELLLVLIFILSGRRQFSQGSQKPIQLAALLVIPVLVSVIWAVNQDLAVAQFLHIGFAMMLFIMLLDKRVDLKWVMMSFVAGLLIQVGLGAVQVASGNSPASTWLGMAAHDATRLGEAVTGFPTGERTLRAHGGFSHPNVLGGYLAVAIVAVLGFWQAAKFEAQRVTLAILGAVLLVGLFLTFSQSAWLGLIMAFIVGAMVALMKNTARARILVVPVAFLIIGGAFAYMLITGTPSSPIDATIELEKRSMVDRVEEYQEYFTVMDTPQEWIFGHGSGNYMLAVADVYPGRYWWQYRPIHNVPLMVVGEIGLLGLVFVLIWSSTIDKINFARFPNREAVTAFMMGNVILFILFFDHYLWTSWAGLALVALVMALTVRMGEKD
ncbi:MAG: O-antigen ligase family protein [Patescibacteria group bacterium]